MAKDRKTMDKMHIPSTLAPQKSLVEMLNGVWKASKGVGGLLKPFSSTSNKLICQMRKKKPTFLFSKPRVCLLGAFLGRLAIFWKKARFLSKNRDFKFFFKIALFASRKIGPEKNPRFFRFLPISRRFFQHCIRDPINV